MKLSSREIYESFESRLAKFWILLFFQISSILCSIFVLYHMLTSKKLRRTLSNHVILAMLTISLLSIIVDLSLTLNYLHEGIVVPQSYGFCFFWLYIDHSLYTCGMLLTAWASFERHILVFSAQYFNLFYKMIFFHYLPIIIGVFYPFIFYCYAIFFYPCQHDEFNFRMSLCGTACFKRESFVLNWYDMLMHSVLPSILIVGYNLALFVRVILQERRLQQQLFSWKKQRRMIVQILSIASLYIIMNIPLFIIILIQQCCDKTFGIAEYRLYVFYLYYFLSICLPFVCLGSLGSLRKKCRRLKRFFKRRVMPISIVNNHRIHFLQNMPTVIMN